MPIHDHPIDGVQIAVRDVRIGSPANITSDCIDHFLFVNFEFRICVAAHGKQSTEYIVVIVRNGYGESSV